MAKIEINLGKGEINKDLVVGIDLGTTNSIIAYVKDGKPKTIKSKNGKSALVPSIIHFESEKKILVGDEAKSKLITSPENTIYSVKRLLGKSYADLNQKNLAYKIIDTNDDSLVKINIGDTFYSPIELSAMILSALKKRAENSLNQLISKAVITVPAYFNDTQRQATKTAGKLAGLDVLRIVNEPTAASLAYGLGISSDQKIVAIYDFGGGTFDISILNIEDNIFEVLSTNGDTDLGGDDIDNAIFEYFISEYNIDSDRLNDKSFYQELRIKSEDCKKYLTNHDEYSSPLAGIHLSMSKSIFEQLIDPILEKTIQNCKNALSDSKLEVSDIDEVILVGGSTRIPLVKAKLTQFFKKEVNDKLHPDETVALGAAIQANILAGNQKGMLLLDVTPLSLGIEMVGGLMDPIIPRNSKIPIRAGRKYTTSVDGQTKLKVSVFQGERDLAKDNRQLGEFILSGIPPMPAGLPKIEIHFILNADGVLVVNAMETRSNTKAKVKIESQYGITEEEMGMMLLESIQNAQEDIKIRGLVEAQIEADNIILSTTKFIDQNKDWLAKEDISKLLSFQKSLKEKRNGLNKSEIEKVMVQINEFSKPLALKALDKNIIESIAGKKI